MKPYFIKSLPKGREIKGIRELFDKNNPFHKAGFDYLDAIEERKLFLCSRDIQSGDVAFHPQYNKGKAINVCTSTEADVLMDGGYKVIGEISPEATWVKEGDEFDEDQVIPFWRILIETWTSAHKGNNFMDLGTERYPENFTEGRIKTILEYYCEENYISAKTIEKPFVAYYEIKGPCGHFH